MNREQAENLLDAYVELKDIVSDCPLCAIQALREVILDAMTLQTQQPTIFPITLPTTQPWTGKPIVTYTPYTVTATCSGIDPLFNQVTGGDA